MCHEVGGPCIGCSHSDFAGGPSSWCRACVLDTFLPYLTPTAIVSVSAAQWSQLAGLEPA